MIFSFLSKIPFLGEFLFALPYLIYFFVSLFTIYTIIVLIISIIYTPAIVGALEEDTMGATFNCYSITWGQPWRIIFYNIILIPLTYISHTIFGYSIYSGFKFMNLIFGNNLLMGSKLDNIVGTAANIVWPKSIGVSIHGGNYLDFHNFFVPSVSENLTWVEWIASFLVGFFILLITISWISYSLSILTVGQTLMLCIFKKRSDNINILERRDEEEELGDAFLEDNINFTNENDQVEINDLSENKN